MIRVYGARSVKDKGVKEQVNKENRKDNSSNKNNSISNEQWVDEQ